MESGKFVEMLDKLNGLKNEGIIDENEYEKQVDTLKKQYVEEKYKHYENTTTQNNIIAFLLLFIFITIGGIWFFSSDIFKDLTIASKDFISNITSKNYIANTNKGNNEKTEKITGQVATNNYKTTTTLKNYQQIYNEYSQKLINAGPTSSINEMANILYEGVTKMARYMYSAKGTDGQYATYQSWVDKLYDVYMNNCR